MWEPSAACQFIRWKYSLSEEKQTSIRERHLVSLLSMKSTLHHNRQAPVSMKSSFHILSRACARPVDASRNEQKETVCSSSLYDRDAAAAVDCTQRSCRRAAPHMTRTPSLRNLSAHVPQGGKTLVTAAVRMIFDTIPIVV